MDAYNVYLIVLTFIKFVVHRCDYCMVYENNRNLTEAETKHYERHIMNRHEAYTSLKIDAVIQVRQLSVLIYSRFCHFRSLVQPVKLLNLE